MDLAPSVVRKIILEEHAQLRIKLAEIESLIQRKDFTLLRNALAEFNYFFLKHVDQEEAILRPVLKDIDSWGSVRVERMNKEHAAQRNEIQMLEELLGTGNPALYLEPAQKFIAELYKDMVAEEKESLNPNLLKDDPVTIDSSSG